MLLRHAKSSWRGDEGDHERPLNARGEAATRLMGAHLAAEPPPDLVLCSTATRARATLAGLTSLDTCETLFERRLYLAPEARLLARLQALEAERQCVLLIAHNPGLQYLAAMLASEADRALAERMVGKYPTAALATFDLRPGDWEALGPSQVLTATLVTPKSL
jgi:phosphohistidine phosphatase